MPEKSIFEVWLNKDYKREIKKREYDGKYLIWRPLIEFSEGNAFSFWWQCEGVFDTENEAKDAFRSMKKYKDLQHNI